MRRGAKKEVTRRACVHRVCGAAGVSDVVHVQWPTSWLSLTGPATSIIFVATKVCMPRQNYVCRDKRFVQRFVATKDMFCRVKNVFVATKVTFVTTNVCCNKTFVATKQAYICRDKKRVLSRQTCLPRQIRVCHDRTFAYFCMLKAYLCRDKRRVLSRQRRVCRDKNETRGISRQ